MAKQRSGQHKKDKYTPIISYEDIERCPTKDFYEDETIRSQLKGFWNQERWDHNFSAEARVIRIDDEASYLSKYTFAQLFYLLNTKLDLNYDIGDPKQFRYGHDAQLIVRLSNKGRSVAVNSRKEDFSPNADNLLFHFDTMNNPKTYKGCNVRRIGKIAEEQKPSVKLAFEKHYHTIGNFTPIPWWIDDTYEGRQEYNLQMLHASLAEWWDALLLYLQGRMPSEKTGSIMSFADYIILTCQFFYVSFGDPFLRKLHTGELSVREFCEEIKKKNGKSPTPWTTQVKKWALMIRRKAQSRELRVVSLAGSSERRVSTFPFLDEIDREAEKYYGPSFRQKYFKEYAPSILKSHDEDEKRESPQKRSEIVFIGMHIARLIEARGRCILGLLKEAQA